MGIIADPERLHMLSIQFYRQAQEWRRQAKRIQENAYGLTNANDKWSGAGANAYRQHCDKLYQNLVSVVSALERSSMALQTLVSQLKYAEQLRQEARRYDRPTRGPNGRQFEDQEELRYLQRRADELRDQASRIASQADAQVARIFDEIQVSVAQMEFTRTTSRRNQQNPYAGLPEHWQKKLQRNPELYEDPDQTSYIPPSQEVLRRRAYKQEREQLVTVLKGVIRRSETYDWWDEQTIHETVEGQFNSYWRYNELTNQELALILEQRGGFETLSAEMQQKIREGKLGDHPEDDPDYLKYVASTLAGPPGQEVSGLDGAIGVGGAAMAGAIMGKWRPNRGGVEPTPVEIPNWKQSETTNSTSANPRPTWRQSEKHVESEYPDYVAQKSFKNGVEVKYGTKGSSRPDLYNTGSSIEVKNYKITTPEGRNRLINNVVNQVIKRRLDLPANTKQTVLIDVRGQTVTNEIMRDIRNKIVDKTDGDIQIKFITD